MNYIIIGAGLSGATLARELADAGKDVLVLEKTKYVGGHAGDDYVHDTMVSRYGPHIFHTSNEETWEYVNRFSRFIDISHRVQSLTNYGWVHWPINRKTIETIYNGEYGIASKKEAYETFLKEIENEQINIEEPNNFEEKAIKAIGKTMYKHLIKNYSELQWKMPASEIPSEVFGRIRIKNDWTESFFDDTYVALPKHGYSNLVASILSHDRIKLITNMNVTHAMLDKILKDRFFSTSLIINTAPVDELLSYEFGALNYLRVDFNFLKGREAEEVSAYWPTPVVNFAHDNLLHTRATSYHKLYESYYPVVVIETPGHGESLYPVRNLASLKMFEKYKETMRNKGIYLLGRLGNFEYIDMHKAIENAKSLAQTLLEK